MAGDPRKTPLVQTFNQFAGQKASEAIQRLGQGLPCHVTAVAGQIVTVAFDIQEDGVTLPPVTIPIATSYYDWLPIQVGDKGLTVAATARLGGISGQGGGTADLTQPANLTALVFAPVANVSWSVPDTNQRVVQGPAGALLRTTGASTPSLNLTTDSITMIAGGHTLVVSSAGISLDGIIFGTHAHDQGVDGHDDVEVRTTGPVNP